MKSVIPKEMGAINLSGKYLGRYMAFCLTLLAMQVFWRATASDDALILLNALVPILFGVSSLFLAWKIVSNSPLGIWNPFTWFLLACVLYYGFGQLVHVFGTEDSVREVNSAYPVDQVGLARTNLLHMLGITICVGTYWLFSSVLTGGKSGKKAPEDSIEMGGRPDKEARLAMILFLSVGVPVKYFLGLAYQLGFLHGVLPGSVQFLGTLTGLALIPLYWLYKQQGKIYRPAFLVLAASEFLIGLVSLSKQAMLTPALMIILATHLHKPDLKKLVLGASFMMLAYVLVLSPFVNFSRIYLQRSSAGSLDEAMMVIEKYKKQGADMKHAALPKAQLWWTRLAYYNMDLFGMDQYDKGKSGDTFLSLAPYVLVPRLLYPDKPIMTPGEELNYLLTHRLNDETRICFGVFGEGYWNGGWWGVVLFSTIVGVSLATYAKFSQYVISSRMFVFIPIVMGGIMMGVGIVGWFVSGYLGPSVQFYLIYIVIRYLVRPFFGYRS
jgi:hypothetical protein